MNYRQDQLALLTKPDALNRHVLHFSAAGENWGFRDRVQLLDLFEKYFKAGEKSKKKFGSKFGVGPELMTVRAWVQNRNRLSYAAENAAAHSGLW